MIVITIKNPVQKQREKGRENERERERENEREREREDERTRGREIFEKSFCFIFAKREEP